MGGDQQRATREAEGTLALRDHRTDQVVELGRAHLALELRREEDLPVEGVGVEEHLVVEDDVVDAHDLVAPERDVVEIRAPPVHREADPEVGVVIEIRPGGDDPVDESRLDERDDARHPQPGRCQRPAQTDADRHVLREHALAEQLGRLAQPCPVVSEESAVDELELDLPPLEDGAVAIAQHRHKDLVGQFLLDRAPLDVEVARRLRAGSVFQQIEPARIPAGEAHVVGDDVEHVPEAGLLDGCGEPLVRFLSAQLVSDRDGSEPVCSALKRWKTLDFTERSCTLVTRVPTSHTIMPPLLTARAAGLVVAGVFLPGTWGAAVIAFLCFRVFDVVKPFPARTIDRRVRGGIGVVGDDLVAGLYAGILTRVLLVLT